MFKYRLPNVVSVDLTYCYLIKFHDGFTRGFIYTNTRDPIIKYLRTENIRTRIQNFRRSIFRQCTVFNKNNYSVHVLIPPPLPPVVVRYQSRRFVEQERGVGDRDSPPLECYGPRIQGPCRWSRTRPRGCRIGTKGPTPYFKSRLYPKEKITEGRRVYVSRL